MAIQELSEQELDISYSAEFVKVWLDGAKPPTPGQVIENLAVVVNGVALYRKKFLDAQEDHDILLARYNELTALTANYVQVIAELRQQNEGLLIETQREFHHERE